MDESLLVSFLAILSVVAFFYFIFYLIARNYKKVNAQWKTLSNRNQLNLNLPPSKWKFILGHYPTISGVYKGLDFFSNMYKQGSGDNQVVYTAFTFRLTTVQDLSFRLYKEGFFSKIGKMVGMQDIQLGHQNFDDQYMIKSDNERFVKQLLNARIRQLFLRKIPNMRGEFSINSNCLEYNEVIMINNESKRKDWQVKIELGYELAKTINEL